MLSDVSRANRNKCFLLCTKIKFSSAVLIFGSRSMVALFIELISRVRTDQSNVGAERSASDSKTVVKQIYLPQYNVALLLIAAVVC